MVKILVLAGSARKASYNKQLAHAAAEALRDAGAEVTEIDLAEYPAPLYDGDLEDSAGKPESIVKLKQLFAEHDGVCYASPEYNSSISPLLKNMIDWVSRADAVDTKGKMVAFHGKTAMLTAASPGALGGLRGLVHLRSILGNIGVWVMPDQVAVGKAHEAFDDTGALVDVSAKKRLKAAAEQFVAVTEKLVS